MRKQIAAIAVAALLVFAGCSAGGDGDATTAAPETTDAPMQTTASDGGGDSPIYESPLDAATVAENHKTAIRDAGSFTLASTSVQSQGNQTRNVESTVNANLETGAVYSTQNASGRVVEVYADGNGTAYQRFVLDGEARYSVPQRTPNATLLARGSIESFVNAFAFEHVGTESVDGTQTDVYEASGFEDVNQSAPGFSELDAENVSNVDARVYVADSGLVKQFEYSLTVQTDSGEVSVEITQQYLDVGSTTVSEPSWLDEAKNSTSQ